MAGNEIRAKASLDDKLSGPLDDIRDKFDKLQKQGAKGFGIGVAAGATTFGLNAIAGAADAAATAVVNFGLQSIDAASDLNETMSKSDVIFGQNAEAIQKWADTMATAAGQSKRDALDAASGFAGLFKTVGLGIDQSTEMAQDLTQMGADLASFFNTDVDQALQALKSGLNGESEPLRAFNVFLSETAVTAKLAEMGIKKTGGAFTEAQKATARYALIMEQTTDAQGDFARTADGQANATRTLNAEIENLQAEIGQHLLPVVKELTVFARDELVPALQGAADWVKENDELFAAFGDTLNLLVNGPLTYTRDKFKDIEDAQKAAFAQKILDHIEEVKKAHQGVGKAASIEAGRIGDLKDETNELVAAQSDMRDIIRDAAKALGEQKYGHQITKDELKLAKIELRENKAELEKLAGIKDPTREQRKDFYETRIEVGKGEQSVIELRGELAASGKVNMSITKSWVDRLKDSLDEAGAKARELNTQLGKLPGASQVRSTMDDVGQGLRDQSSRTFSGQ